MEILTARLRLRRARAEDLEAFFQILSDPRAMRYWSTLPHQSREVTAEWLGRALDGEGQGGDDFVIEYQGRVIGKVGAWRLPEFGFILHPDFWGQGFAIEAARAYLDHAFADPDVDEITADVDPRNAASLGLLAKLGFTETGRATRTFLLGDEWCDSVYLRLLRADWQPDARGP